MACHPCILLAKRLFRDLHDNFLAHPQHFGDELRPPVLLGPLVRPWLVGAFTPASAAISAAAAHGPLKPGAGLVGDSRTGGRCLRGLSHFLWTVLPSGFFDMLRSFLGLVELLRGLELHFHGLVHLLQFRCFRERLGG
jgi:hypothetical protein